MSNVRSYTTQQVLDRVKSNAKGFSDYPSNYWLIGVRSNEDEFNKFDDKFYLFHGLINIGVYEGTTNAGAKGLKHFDEYNKLGCAVLQSDRIVYNSHYRGISKGRMVYRQNLAWPYYRDNDKDNYAEEIGEVYNDVIHAHIHDIKLDNREVFKEFINGNSLACQVFARGKDYDFFMDRTEEQDLLTYCILKEWEV